jgi:hypothetical protein
VLDFQRFVVLAVVFSGSGFRHFCLLGKAKTLDFQRFANITQTLVFNAFTHLYGAGGWVKGRVLSKG